MADLQLRGGHLTASNHRIVQAKPRWDLAVRRSVLGNLRIRFLRVQLDEQTKTDNKCIEKEIIDGSDQL